MSDELRELDQQIATVVMGLVWNDAHCRICGGRLDPKGMFCTPTSCSLRPAPSRRADESPHYSTDIKAAMEVVERMREQELFLEAEVTEKEWLVIFWTKGADIAARFDAVSLPEAICRAALKAIREEG